MICRADDTYQRDTDDALLLVFVFSSVQINGHGVCEDQRVGNPERHEWIELTITPKDTSYLLVQVLFKAEIRLQA